MWECYSAKNPGQKGRKRRKIEKMVERMQRAEGKKDPPSKLDAEWNKKSREREIEILQAEQEREREYFDLRKAPLPAVVAALALLAME